MNCEPSSPKIAKFDEFDELMTLLPQKCSKWRGRCRLSSFADSKNAISWVISQPSLSDVKTSLERVHCTIRKSQKTYWESRNIPKQTHYWFSTRKYLHRGMQSSWGRRHLSFPGPGRMASPPRKISVERNDSPETLSPPARCKGPCTYDVRTEGGRGVPKFRNFADGQYW